MKAIIPLAIGILGIISVTTFIMLVIPILTMKIHLSIILTDIYDSNAVDLLTLSLISYKYDHNPYYKYLAEDDTQVIQEFLGNFKLMQNKFGIEKRHKTIYIFVPYDQKSKYGSLVKEISLGE
ncbi:MAG: hypothetical protein QXY79_01305 [Candidatus Methanomethylicia archaeon]